MKIRRRTALTTSSKYSISVPLKTLITICRSDCLCEEGFIKQGSQCVEEGSGCNNNGYECPRHSEPNDGVTCPHSFGDCTCKEGFYRKETRCKRVPCPYDCPAYSTKKPGVDCPSDFGDCICDLGYEKHNGQCVYCSYICPQHSIKIVHGCPSNFMDCECPPPYVPVGGRCRFDIP